MAKAEPHETRDLAALSASSHWAFLAAIRVLASWQHRTDGAKKDEHPHRLQEQKRNRECRARATNNHLELHDTIHDKQRQLQFEERKGERDRKKEKKKAKGCKIKEQQNPTFCNRAWSLGLFEHAQNDEPLVSVQQRRGHNRGCLTNFVRLIPSKLQHSGCQCLVDGTERKRKHCSAKRTRQIHPCTRRHRKQTRTTKHMRARKRRWKREHFQTDGTRNVVLVNLQLVEGKTVFQKKKKNKKKF